MSQNKNREVAPVQHEAGKADVPRKQGAPAYDRQQLAACGRFQKKKDLVNALLKEGEKYTMEQADKIIEDFMKGKVK